MIHILNERVVSFSREYLDIYWEIAPTNDDLQEWEFYVERSEAEGGPWVQVAGPMIDRYYVRDNTVPTISNSRIFFYRIRAHQPSIGKGFYSRVIDREGDPDLIASEIIRREQLLWREHAGVQMWVFPIRTFGQRCPQCYDPVLGKRNQDFCATCFNTSFSGGYHYPISFWGQVDVPEGADQITMDDHRQTEYYVMRAGPTPSMKPLDLVIDHMNRRHRIISIGGTLKTGASVRQEVRLVQVQKGSVEDKVPLKIEEDKVILRPPRNYTNPQNLEDATSDVAIDSILDTLYKY